MNHELQISLFEDDIKCTLDSILDFCEVEFACIHSLSDNQPFCNWSRRFNENQQKHGHPCLIHCSRKGIISNQHSIKQDKRFILRIFD